MANTENKSIVRFSVDIPAEVNNVLVTEAKKNRRSRTQHVVFILEQYAEEVKKEETQEASA